MVEYSAGIVTAYGSAKRAGYTGTYEDFCRQQAQYAQNASAVEQAKQTAVSASQSADQAKQDAQTASTTAQQSAQSAQGSAQSAGQSAQDAQTAKNNAQTYAQSASASAGSAQQSAQNAQAVLESIPEDYSDLSEDVDKLKADLDSLDESLGAQTELINGIPPVTDWVDGKSIASGTGIENTASANFKCTDFVEIPEGTTKLWITMRIAASYSNLGLAFYDENKEYTGSGVRENYTTAKGWEYRKCNVPANAVYFRTTWYGAADTTEHPEFSVYTNKQFSQRLDDMQTQIDDAIIPTENLSYTNIYNPDDTEIEEGYEIASNGNKTTNSVMIISGFIPVEEGKHYMFPVYVSHFGTSNSKYVPCYNSSKEWIRNAQGTLSNKILDVGIGAGNGIKYIRVNICRVNANSNYIETPFHSRSNFMVIPGQTFPSRYIPYTEQKIMDGNVYSANEDLRNPLYGKKVVFLGDSICEASTDDSGGFSQRIGIKNTMLWENAGIGGSTIAITSANKTICTRQFKMTDPDYIILEGGTNDADRIGTATGETKPENFGSFDPDEYGTDDASTYYGFNINTFCGACDYMCKRFLTEYPGAKIGFIGAHKMGQVLATRKNRGYYIQTAMDICKKWGIPVLDLWNGSYLNPMLPAHYTAGEDYLYADGQHLYPKGYAYITPMIEAFMKSL